jgi:hypothetical protein
MPEHPDVVQVHSSNLLRDETTEIPKSLPLMPTTKLSIQFQFQRSLFGMVSMLRLESDGQLLHVQTNNNGRVKQQLQYLNL